MYKKILHRVIINVDKIAMLKRRTRVTPHHVCDTIAVTALYGYTILTGYINMIANFVQYDT